MLAATDSLGKSHPESVQLRLDRISDSVKEAGYTSIFHAALEAARTAVTSDRKELGRRELREFVNSGDMSEFYNLSHSARHINRLPHEQEAIHTQLVTDAAAQIFQKEWRRLTQCDALRMSLSSFTPGFVSSFSFDDIYENIQNCAPTLLSLIESFNPDPAPGAVEAPETTISRRRRLAITSITTLLSGRSLSTVQSIITYYLYASRVPKRVFTILNSLGISNSYSTLIRTVEQQADEAKKILKGIAARGQAIQISFDNINWQNDVRYMRLHNWISFGSGVVGYVLIPAKFTPMFHRSAVNYDAAKDLTLRDFLPSQKDHTILLGAFRYMLFDVVKDFAKSLKLPAPTADIPPPKVSPLDLKLRPKIHTLPLYDLNETRMDEMIQILYRIQKDIGLSSEQVQKNIILHKGDLLTILNTRSPFSATLPDSLTELIFRKGKFQQLSCSPKARLNYIEPAPGLLHMEMAVLLLFYRTHLGAESDACSLSRWIKELNRIETRLWDKSSSNVKNFNACMDFFNIVLDGCILATFANACGAKSVQELSQRFSQIDIEARISEIANFLVKFDQVDKNRRKEIQDSAHDNLILFLQHGLTLRNFSKAIRGGDPGRYLASLSYFTIWFQGSRQHNYAAETIHLTACLKACWSKEFREFFLENSLINLSGTKNGWMPCDAVNERVVKEAKAMRVNNSNPATDDHWRNVVSLQTMLLPDVKEKMAEECGSFIFDYHSSAVEGMTDAKAVATILLRDGVCKQRKQRDVSGELGKQGMVADLFVRGQLTLATTKRIAEFKKGIVSGGLVVDERVDNNRAALVQEDMEGDNRLPDDSRPDLEAF